MQNGIFDHLAEIITASQASFLGIVALGICAMSLLAAYLFPRSSDRVKVSIYALSLVALFVGLVLVAYGRGGGGDGDRGNTSIANNSAGNGSSGGGGVVPVLAPRPGPSQPVPRAGGGDRGWVYYAVEDHHVTEDGKLRPSDNSPMPAFGELRDGLILKAQEGVRMYESAGRTNLVTIIDTNDCVRVLHGRQPYRAYDTYSGGWVEAERALCR
jgi:hypothetical protein